MHPLDELLRDYVVPVLKPLGFAKRARLFVLGNDVGDEALVEFHSRTAGEDKIGFFINLGICTPQWDEFLTSVHGPSRRTTAESMWRTRLDAPAGAGPGQEWEAPDLWGFALETGPEACGQALAKALAEEAVPMLIPLLDREFLLAAVRTRKYCSRSFAGHWRSSELALRVREDPVAEMYALAAELDADWKNAEVSPVAAWARTVLDERVAASQ